MKSTGVLLAGIFVLIVAGAVALIVLPAPQKAVAPTNGSSTAQASLPDLITVVEPLPGATVTSPLTIKGEARGNWYFEASAPVTLYGQSGGLLAQGHVQAQGEWMTTDYVPFEATLAFPAQPAGSSGTLIVKNDNPSGDPSRDKTLEIPVKF